MEEIKFYKTSEPYGEFSNFYAAPVILINEIWPTAEHYFQAMKFENVGLWDRIKAMNSPMEAANEGRNRKNKLRPDWEEVKETVMLKAVKAKFFQHHRLKKLLMGTGDALIIEHTSNDHYWADGGDGTGKNKLGIILMKVRQQLFEVSNDPDVVFPPWVAFPNNEPGGMFWGMGWGEDYVREWSAYVNLYGKEEYKLLFPIPSDWGEDY